MTVLFENRLLSKLRQAFIQRMHEVPKLFWRERGLCDRLDRYLVRQLSVGYLPFNMGLFPHLHRLLMAGC